MIFLFGEVYFILSAFEGEQKKVLEGVYQKRGIEWTEKTLERIEGRAERALKVTQG